VVLTWHPFLQVGKAPNERMVDKTDGAQFGVNSKIAKV
jgi:hypothetical protein